MSPRQGGRPSPQLTRIARLVHTDVDELAGLAGVADADLRTLHDQIAEMYFGAGRESFARVAGLSKALPGPIAGKLAQHFLPPHLAAQVAVLLEPAKARDLVGRVSVPYLADLSLSLDPTRSRPVVEAIPPARIGEITAELFRRGDYVAVAEFAATVTPDGLRAALATASGRDLLALVPLLVWTEPITAAVTRASDRQLDNVVAVIATDAAWDDAEDFLAPLPPAARERIAQRLARADDGVRASWAAAADAGVLGTAGLAVATSARV